MDKISLTASMRSNLRSLQNISRQVSDTQNRLSTGKKVNAAIDNPSSYYTARSLDNRANDLNALLDSMGQSVSTVKAATQGIETGIKLLEQMKSVAEQALENPLKAGAAEGGAANPGKSVEELEAEGYRVVSTAADLQAAITAGAKIALGGDITLDTALNIAAADVTIDGNGHTLKYTPAAAREAVIAIDGAGSSADIKNLNIEASGDRVYGIRVTNGGSLTLDNTSGIRVSGTGAQKLVSGNADLYDGKSNTQAILNQIGADALAATAANQFYVGDKNGEFGQGTWYLPSIGELMQMYGTNTGAMTSGSGTSGAVGDNKTLINSALTTLAGKGADAAALTNGYYWSSSEYYSYGSWLLYMNGGTRYGGSKGNNYYVRSFQLVENCFDPLTLSDASGVSGAAAAPKIGDVMYADKTYGSADDYDGSKTAVGIVTAVSADGRDATIVNLKDLTFSSTGSVGNFDPDNPYGQSNKYSAHTTSAKYNVDVTDIPNYDYNALLNAVKTGGTLNVTNTPFTAGGTGGGGTGAGVDSSWQDSFNRLLNQYDMLIDDSSYKGVNLLKADSLEIRFNESRTSSHVINGQDISSAQIGLGTAAWATAGDVLDSLDEIRGAISTLRSYSGALGNSYSIIQTRQNFTDALIDVLTEGADKLTLADMNEESANMLALQTRQQLAVTSLSLASEGSGSILNLFR